MTVQIAVILALAILTQSQMVLPSFKYDTCCSDKTITVNGEGTIQADPDIATLSAQVTVNSKTVDQAVKSLSNRVALVISILTTNGLNTSNYETSSLNIYPNTSYPNGVATVIGQIATQSFNINIPIVDKSGGNIGKLIDSLAALDGIVLNGLSFDVSDKTAVFAQARAAAYAEAQEKAQDYTLALQLCLGQLVTVVDSYSSAPSNALLAVRKSDVTPTTVNVGRIPISYFVKTIYSYA